MKFLQIILKRGYLAVFSDYSLKALIKNWDSSILGKNPFVNIGVHSGPALIRFESK